MRFFILLSHSTLGEWQRAFHLMIHHKSSSHYSELIFHYYVLIWNFQSNVAVWQMMRVLSRTIYEKIIRRIYGILQCNMVKFIRNFMLMHVCDTVCQWINETTSSRRHRTIALHDIVWNINSAAASSITSFQQNVLSLSITTSFCDVIPWTRT